MGHLKFWSLRSHRRRGRRKGRKEEGGRRRRKRKSSAFKSNNPILKGGEQTELTHNQPQQPIAQVKKCKNQ